MMKLTIGHLYPELLNLYGDRGKIQCLRKRLQWRGFQAEILPLSPGSRIDFGKLDILLLGGGPDKEQALACEYLTRIQEDFRAYAEDYGIILAICGGYQLLGQYYQTAESKLKGLGVLDIYTEWEPKRLVHNVVLDSPFFRAPVTGFENHCGRTYIGSYTPLGKVRYGRGNTGKSGYEGLVYKNILATYLHGPLLPKNPEICDDLLRKALLRKYGSVRLAPLPDEMEHLAGAMAAKRLHKPVFC